MASRAYRLGWLAAILFGQQHGWASGTSSEASGTSTCDSVVVSGVDAFDGTYTYSGHNSDSGDLRPVFEMVTGTDEYYVFWYATLQKWAISDMSSSAYMTNDDPEHPVDITMEWALCSIGIFGDVSCPSVAAESQPTIICNEDAGAITPQSSPTPAPTTAAPTTAAPTTAAPTTATPTTPTPTTAAPIMAGAEPDGTREVATAPPSSPENSSTLSPGDPPVDSSNADSNGEGQPGDDSGTSAETAIGIASVVVAFLGVVTGALWGTASTVYVNCKCCSSSGSGPVLTVGPRAPKEKWLPLRMASNARVFSPTPKVATELESQAIVSSVTAGLESISWTPIPAATGMSLRLTVDGRSYIFEACATSTTNGGGTRFVVGSINKAKTVEREILAQVVDIVTVNEVCALATDYPSRGRFRILGRCASHASSFVTYAVVETICEHPYVLVLR